MAKIKKDYNEETVDSIDANEPIVEETPIVEEKIVEEKPVEKKKTTDKKSGSITLYKPLKDGKFSKMNVPADKEDYYLSLGFVKNANGDVV